LNRTQIKLDTRTSLICVKIRLMVIEHETFSVHCAVCTAGIAQSS